jgi:hypothetical protein
MESMFKVDKLHSEPKRLSQAERLKTVIGLTEHQAKAMLEAYGYRVRIVQRDREHYIVTMDYRTDRVNITIINGKVTNATFG